MQLLNPDAFVGILSRAVISHTVHCLIPRGLTVTDMSHSQQNGLSSSIRVNKGGGSAVIRESINGIRSAQPILFGSLGLNV